MQTICFLLGVAEDDRHELFAVVEPGFDFRRPATAPAPRAPSPFDMMAVRPRAHRREARATRPTTCCRPWCTPRSTTRIRPGSPTTSSPCSSPCCSPPGARPPATRSPAACIALIEHPEQLAALRAATRELHAAPRSRRCCAGPRRRRRSDAPRRATVELARPRHRSRRQGRDLGGLGQPRRARVRRARSSTSPRSEPAPAFGHGAPLLPGRAPGPARAAGDVRRGALAVHHDRARRRHRVDPQQPPHRHPPPPPHPDAGAHQLASKSANISLASTHVEWWGSQCSRGTA